MFSSVLLFVVGFVLVSLTCIGLILSRMYQKASKEYAFVRTGLGGQKVVLDTGMLVVPIFQTATKINMKTLKLQVSKDNKGALITKDKMRVDVTAEFYVRVSPNASAVAIAAQTLGQGTMNIERLKELVESKLVDALRSVAAQMKLNDLHEQRSEFVQTVQKTLVTDLQKNGLELESVSLTRLDQTDIRNFNENNAFDAEGLTTLTQTIEEKKKIRNDIEKQTEVEIAQRNLEAEKQTLAINREQEYATLEQQREISIRRAEQESEIEKQQALRNQEAEEARIESNLSVQQKQIEANKISEKIQIEKDQAISAAEIERDKQLEQADIERNQAIQKANIEKNRNIEALQIEKQQTIEMAEVKKKTDVAIQEQNQRIDVAQKEEEAAIVETRANAEKAKSISAQEKIATAQSIEIAERQKAIELIEAKQEAEKQAVKVKVQAEAEKQAAEDKAESVRITIEAEASATVSKANADAEAVKVKAEADRLKYEVDAKGKLDLNAAENSISEARLTFNAKVELIKGLPSIIEKTTKPMEAIKDIRIVQFDGGQNLLGGGASTQGDTSSEKSLPEQVVDAALKHQVQQPLMEGLIHDLGLKSTSSLMDLFKGKGK